MIRQIIKINEDKCNGCGACASACHEGAIEIVNGKAKLTREDYCDGLGDCLPACPTGAITFENREAPAYDEAAVLAAKEAKESKMPKAADGANEAGTLPCGCPGTHVKQLHHVDSLASTRKAHAPGCPGSKAKALHTSGGPDASAQHFAHSACESTCSCDGSGTSPSQAAALSAAAAAFTSKLMQWPVQIKLVPVNAPYFDGANLLVAADCTAYAYGNFHNEFMRNHITLIGCPKLDACDYSEKLTEIISNNDIKSVTVTRMEVPCCGGIENAVRKAIQASGKFIPWRIVTISADGELL